MYSRFKYKSKYMGKNSLYITFYILFLKKLKLNAPMVKQVDTRDFKK